MNRILLVEDNAETRKTITQFLGRSDWVWEETDSLLEAVCRLNTKKPDLIILDLNLVDARPEITVYQIPFLKKFAPVVIMSGDCRSAAIGMDFGAEDFLMKPVDFTELERVVQRLLEDEKIRKLTAASLGEMREITKQFRRSIVRLWTLTDESLLTDF